MSYKYSKQNWEPYDKTLPTRLQENSLITKERLEHIEEGIEKNSKPLTIGELKIGDSEIPSASVEDDDDAQEVRLNIVFPKQSQIEDDTIKDDATWSSRKIRNEIDNVASNVRYTCEISSDEGLIFNTQNDVKTLRAKIFMTGTDITDSCDESAMKWTRKSNNTDYDDFWNGKGYVGTNVVISAAEMNDTTNVTFYCSYSGVNDEGATISAIGSVTVCNMIFEAVNTSVSFNLDAPNGTIFDNKSDSTMILNAQAYQGSMDLSTQANFRWYMNSVWIPGEEKSSLSYPVVGLPLVTIFTCEMSYEGMTYKSSVTIQNRKNVTVSDTPSNDPQIGDIWYDVTVEMYKKWTENGWKVIEEPTQEVTGDVLLSVSAIKTVQETEYEINTLRQATYEMKDELDGKIQTNLNYINEAKESADQISRTLTATREIVDTYEDRIVSTEKSVNDIKATSEKFQVNITKKVEDLENSSASDENIKKALEASSSAVQTAEKIYWLVEQGSDQTNLTLTSEFMSLLTGNVVIDAKKIDLRGYTTINDDGTGGFTVDESGYMIANNGGKIGPWDIGNESLSMTTTDGDYVYLGTQGLKFSDKLLLTPMGGIETPNFKVDPIGDSVYINADYIYLAGVEIATVESKLGVRNLILTSGAYKTGKTTHWMIDELPWTMQVETSAEDPDDDTAVTYMTFTKCDDVEDETYIKIPLSEVLTTGKYIFNINVFTTGETHPSLHIYLITEDGATKQIGEISSLGNRPVNVTFTYDHSSSTEYKYIGFDCSQFAIGDTFSIVNLSLYKSEVTIREWQPAPEDSVQEYEFLNEALNETVSDISITMSDLKGEITTKISSIFESEEWTTEKESIFSQDVDGVSIETITGKIEEVQSATSAGLDAQGQRITKLYEYIDFKNGDITLGNNMSNIKLNISNDRMSYIQNEIYELAYFSSTKMFVNELEAVQSLQIGRFKFIPRSNGRLSIVMVGESVS